MYILGHFACTQVYNIISGVQLSVLYAQVFDQRQYRPGRKKAQRDAFSEYSPIGILYFGCVIVAAIYVYVCVYYTYVYVRLKSNALFTAFVCGAYGPADTQFIGYGVVFQSVQNMRRLLNFARNISYICLLFYMRINACDVYMDRMSIASARRVCHARSEGSGSNPRIFWLAY